MTAAVETSVETEANVEAQSESAGPDISQAYDYDETDAGQTEIPVSEDEQTSTEVEGQELTHENVEGSAQEEGEEGVGETKESEEEKEEAESAGAAGYEPQQQTPEFDTELLRRAEQVGIPAHQAKTWPSPDALRTTVNELVWQRPGAAQQPAPTQPQQPKPLTVDDFKVGEEFTAEDLGETTAKQLNALRNGAAEQAFKQDQVHRKQVEDLQRAVGGMVSQSQASAVHRDADTFDTFVQGRKELHAHLGKGPMASLKADSPQAKLRCETFNLAQQLAGMYTNARVQKSAADICSDAVAIVLKDRMKTAANQEVASTLKARKGQALGKATQRTSDARTREQKAIENADARMRAMPEPEPVDEL